MDFIDYLLQWYSTIPIFCPFQFPKTLHFISGLFKFLFVLISVAPQDVISKWIKFSIIKLLREQKIGMTGDMPWSTCFNCFQIRWWVWYVVRILKSWLSNLTGLVGSITNSTTTLRTAAASSWLMLHLLTCCPHLITRQKFHLLSFRTSAPEWSDNFSCF